MRYSHATNQVFSHRGQRFIEIELVLPDDLLYVHVRGSVVGNVQARSMTLYDCTYFLFFCGTNSFFSSKLLELQGSRDRL